ncbi:DUF771 domain-containing protein [Xylocopilactobacillus apis]|uniref:DUF771 domain-containing protein n=1 Tax=Xylocopilactobacillus apis TaxID=2932183 RepID=A0AAU9DB14_9LACO|nr:DUF771 domain-containing protein [Xylocopilactobacillus apis]BDR56910.1 hypothetical protein KIMC2_14720 [Xylocopilactobacillus apis]
MQQTIRLDSLTIPIPEGFEILPKAEVNDLRKKADLSCWWTMGDVEKRYHRKREWIKKVLYSKKFRPLLEHKCVMYAGTGGRRTYLFEPVGFSKFMREWFPEITREMEKGVK